MSVGLDLHLASILSRPSSAHLAQVQPCAKQYWRGASPALERTAEVISVMKAQMPRDRVVVMPAVHQAQRYVSAHQIELGLKVTAVAGKLALEGGRADSECVCRTI